MSRIDICLCTFRRPHLALTLASLDALRVPTGAALRVIVADNDDTDSARGLVAARTGGLPVTYVHAPARNISVARNACLDHADADRIAFIDDDEIAEPDWLLRLLARAQETGADAVFGPARAVYGPGTPDWMVRRDYHSNIPEARNGEVMTGHSCNALLRWAGTPWHAERFDLARGRTGGEDTEFFFRLHRLGARFAIAEDAIVREEVDPARLSYGWLRARKFRSGHCYAASAPSLAARARLCASSAAKAGISAAAALACLRDEDRNRFWRLRCALHLGVCAGCLSLEERAHYGQ